MPLSAEELRTQIVKHLEDNKGKFFSSGKLAEIFDEDSERIRSLLIRKRPSHVLSRPGGGGGFIVPLTATIDPFENLHFGFGRILRFLKRHEGQFCSRYEIGRAADMTPESVRVVIIRNRLQIPNGWKVEGRIGQYGGYRLVRTSDTSDTDPAAGK